MKDKKKTSDYSQGKIYKIVCNKTGLFYIGSTYRSLEQRLKEHIGYYKAYIGKKSNHLISSIYVTFNNDCKIELIENYPCNNKKELEKRELFYINNTECVNTFRNNDSCKNIDYQEKFIKMLVDKCGKDAITNILFRYGIDEYTKNNNK